MTAPLRVQLRVGNNRLKRAREALGFLSAMKFCRAAGIKYEQYVAIENCSLNPYSRSNGALRRAAAQAIEYLGLSESEAFPVDVLAVQQPSVVKEIEASELKRLSSGGDGEVVTPEALAISAEASSIVNAAINTLCQRDRTLLRLRFEDGATLEQAGIALGLSRSRTAELEARALRRLRSRFPSEYLQ